MNEQESRSVLAIVLMAAHADGRKDDSERAAVRKVAESLGTGSGIDLASLHRDVLLAPPDLAQLAATLERTQRDFLMSQSKAATLTVSKPTSAKAPILETVANATLSLSAISL